MSFPKIESINNWTVSKVRQVCIDNELYTRGDIKAYDNMLDLVKASRPTNENIYMIAKDIVEHSENQTITNVMYILKKFVVYTTFSIDDSYDV